MLRKITFFACLLALISSIFSAYFHLTAVNVSVLTLQNVSTEPFALLNSWKLPYFWALSFLNLLVLIVVAWRPQTHHCKVATTVVTVMLLMGLQVFTGVWAIETQGMPLAVTLEISLGFINFWLLFRLYLQTHPKLVRQTNRSVAGYFAYAAILLLFVQILLGVWSSSNTSSLMCSDFPRCQGQWLPAQADFINGLNLFNGVVTHYFGVISFDAQLAVHWLHRVGGGITFIVLVLLMLNVTSVQQPKPIRKAGLLMSIFLLIELGLGTFSIKLGLPLWIMMAHNSFAALLMLPLIAISVYSRYGFVVDAPQVDAVIEKSPTVDVQPSSTDPLYLRLTSQLKKTRHGLGGILTSLPLGQKGLSEDLLDKIEAQLLLADIGVEATTDIINKLTENLDKHQLKDSEALLLALKKDLLDILTPCDHPLVISKQDKPFVILVIGVNGAGKTTTIGKLAKKLQNQGHSVMLAAGDTFRAAAVEQLQVWGERNDVQVVAQHSGADSASVVFDALQSAQAKGIDVLIADTAGRLHTKSNLMQELEKIKRIMGKLDDTAPHEVLLVLDAGTGQNALSQAKLFNETVTLTGLILTKLDGTAKGGVIFALAKQLNLPIRHIGIGEGIDDLQEFNAKHFVDALFVTDE
ncbi:MAG: signal recognition particle-docking protein FtsY [Methylococcales bacterium]|nr:signal recognition particle-docking protein FtsY [Methylococcales bacterium]